MNVRVASRGTLTRLAVCAAILSAAISGNAAQVVVPTADGDGMERIASALPELMATHHVPGVAVALVRDRRVVAQRGFGVKRAGGDDPVDENTVFEACSMTKPVFAYVVLKLREAGDLDIDKPLDEYLDEPYLSDDPRHKRITARMVLSHTSGFPNWRKGGRQGGGSLKTEFEPGTKFQYSGEGFLYLQRVVEHRTSAPADELVRRKLLEPLRMRHSDMVWQDRFEKLAAAGHDAEGKPEANRPLYKSPNAAYTLYTTPGDYALFLIEIMRADRAAPQSLSKESVAEMLTRTSNVESIDNARGLGWAIQKTPRGDRIHHSGANGTGFRCYCRFDPADGSGIVIMTNAIGGKKLYDALLEGLADRSPHFSPSCRVGRASGLPRGSSIAFPAAWQPRLDSRTDSACETHAGRCEILTHPS
jgi:CubicO group peptidase (beta-lactamase class C family)